MKTPLEVARQELPEYIGDSNTSDGFDHADMIAFAENAIITDRIQHSRELAIEQARVTAVQDLCDRVGIANDGTSTVFVGDVLEALTRGDDTVDPENP